MAEAGSKSYNMRNPAVKRILQEVKEMAKEQSTEYMSMPLEEDIFEWQFTVHGPKDSEFEGGIYHGRITLPSDYPFKPPSFMLLTPSGRFETQTKICLSISNHHPEHWQPSWSVRTALVALIAFMPTKPNGAIGSLDYTKKERRALAIKSRQNPPQFGSPERQRIIQQLHEAMLKTAPPVPTTPLVEDEPTAPGQEDAGEGGAGQQPKAQSTPEPANPAPAAAGASSSDRNAAPPTSEHPELAPELVAAASAITEAQTQLARAAGADPVAAPARASERAPASQTNTVAPNMNPRQAVSAASRPESETYQEWLLSAVAAVLVLAILFILGQKIARAYTGVAFTGGESEL